MKFVVLGLCEQSGDHFTWWMNYFSIFKKLDSHIRCHHCNIMGVLGAPYTSFNISIYYYLTSAKCLNTVLQHYCCSSATDWIKCRSFNKFDFYLRWSQSLIMNFIPKYRYPLSLGMYTDYWYSPSSVCCLLPVIINSPNSIRADNFYL